MSRFSKSTLPFLFFQAALGLAAWGCATSNNRESPGPSKEAYIGRWDLDREASVRRQMAAKNVDWAKIPAARQKEAIEQYPLFVQVELGADGKWKGFFRTQGQKGTLGSGSFRAKGTGPGRWDFLFMEENTPDRTVDALMEGDLLILKFQPSDPTGIVLCRRAPSEP